MSARLGPSRNIPGEQQDIVYRRSRALAASSRSALEAREGSTGDGDELDQSVSRRAVGLLRVKRMEFPRWRAPGRPIWVGIRRTPHTRNRTCFGENDASFGSGRLMQPARLQTAPPTHNRPPDTCPQLAVPDERAVIVPGWSSSAYPRTMPANKWLVRCEGEKGRGRSSAIKAGELGAASIKFALFNPLARAELCRREIL